VSSRSGSVEETKVAVNSAPATATLEYPALYGAADAASRAGRVGHTRLVVTDLALLAAAAVVGVVFERLLQLGAAWQAAAAAMLLALALISKLATRLRSFDSQWFDGRAVAETVKSAAWRYAMRIPPYDAEGTATDQAFVESLREALAARSSLAPFLAQFPADSPEITPSLRALRALPPPERTRRYLAERVVDQIGWYRGKAGANARAARRWFWVGLAAEGAALVAAIALVAVPTLPELGLIGGLTTVAAVATAWTQFSRHDELSQSYALAAQELAFLRSGIEGATTETGLHRAVAEAESAISREHTMWMARRS
jgi:hypothetical protein